MRIGLFLGDLLGGPLEGVVDGIASTAEEGFDSAWLPQVFGWDTLTLLALAAQKAPGIELGTAVVPSYPRHPSVLAGQAMTTQAASGGRLTLGIGLSHKVVVEGMWGYSFDRPARHMREYLAVLQPLLRGEQVDFSGETLRGSGSLTVPSLPTPPVLLAALAPAMLGLAGREADGTLTWMVGPKTLASHIVPRISVAAEKAGRTPPRIVAGLPVLVTDDADAGRQRAAKSFAMYGELPSYRAMIDLEGVEGPAGIAVVGNEDHVATRLAEVADNGATELVASPFGRPDDKARTRALLSRLRTEA